MNCNQNWIFPRSFPPKLVYPMHPPFFQDGRNFGLRRKKSPGELVPWFKGLLICLGPLLPDQIRHHFLVAHGLLNLAPLTTWKKSRQASCGFFGFQWVPGVFRSRGSKSSILGISIINQPAIETHLWKPPKVISVIRQSISMRKLQNLIRLGF